MTIYFMARRRIRIRKVKWQGPRDNILKKLRVRVVKVSRNNTGIAIWVKMLLLCRVGKLFNRGSSRKEVQAKRRQQRRESVAAVAAAVAAHHTAVNASDVAAASDHRFLSLWKTNFYFANN